MTDETEPPQPIFAVGDRVAKYSGDYTGPGFIRQVVRLPDGRLRYLVGHRIEGGTGEFLHIYSERQLGRYRDD